MNGMDSQPSDKSLGYFWMSLRDTTVVVRSRDRPTQATIRFHGNMIMSLPGRDVAEVWQNVCNRSDVYSLGTTLYELLTLEPVFQGDDKQAILREIAFDEPRPPRQLDRSFPFELETILLKTLAKNPEEQYATAGAFAEDLRRFLEQKPLEAQRPTRTDRLTKWALRNRRFVIVSAAGLLLTAVTLAVASLLVWNEQHKTHGAGYGNCRKTTR